MNANRTLKGVKVCTTCQVEKDFTEFNKHAGRKDSLQTVCRSCNRMRSRQYYAENREKHLKVVSEKRKVAVRRNQEHVYEYLRINPCSDCGEDDPVVLEFDHQGNKDGDVASAICSPWGLSRLKSEIEKCEVVCANCHARRTAQSRGYFKYRMSLGV